MYTGGEIAGEVIETGEGVKMLSKVTIIELLSTDIHTNRQTDRQTLPVFLGMPSHTNFQLVITLHSLTNMLQQAREIMNIDWPSIPGLARCNNICDKLN